MGQAGCPGREPDCLKPAGTWVGVSARMYNDSNSLGDRAKEGRGSERRHAGTGEGISARIHVANSNADRAEEAQRSDCKHSANSLWERDDSCMLVGASIVVAGVGIGVCWSGCVSRAGRVEGGSVFRDPGVQGSGIDKSVDESIDGTIARKDFHPTRHPGSHFEPNRALMSRVKRGGFVLRRGKHPGQRNCPGCLRVTPDFFFWQSEQQQPMKWRTAVQ